MEGNVVMCDQTGQAGTLYSLTSDQAQVLLTNGEIWVGSRKMVHIPLPGELEQALYNVERVAPAPKPARRDF